MSHSLLVLFPFRRRTAQHRLLTHCCRYTAQTFTRPRLWPHMALCVAQNVLGHCFAPCPCWP